MSFPMTTYAVRFADGRLDVTSDEIVALRLTREFRRGNHPLSKAKRIEHITTITCIDVEIDDIVDHASTAPTNNVGTIGRSYTSQEQGSGPGDVGSIGAEK